LDINQLFQKPQHPGNNADHGKKTVCVIDSFLTAPLVEGLDDHFRIIKESSQNCLRMLREGHLDAGIIPAIDYAEGKGNWKIIPGGAIAAGEGMRQLNLFFNTEIRHLNKIAFDQSSQNALVLLKIILQEKYQITPQWVAIEGDLTKKLEGADAAILTGDLAYQQHLSNHSYIDLVDEWYDLTGLPFVYALWIVNDTSFPEQYIPAIKERLATISDHMPRAAKRVSQALGGNWKKYDQYFKTVISYQFSELEQQGLHELFRYAFFYGVIDHLPDLHFFSL